MDEARILSNAIASLEMEGLHPSEHDMDLATAVLRGEVTVQQATGALTGRFLAAGPEADGGSCRRPEDPEYCYPGTDVLRNKLGIHDPAVLTSAEAGFALLRTVELDIRPVEGCFDIGHLKEVHRRLFSDLYDWAGEIRTAEMSNDILSCPCRNILSCLDSIFSELEDESWLRGIDDKDAMADRLAYYMSELNAIHPFREGNGLVQRKFIEQIAGQAGFELDFGDVGYDEMADAGRESMVCDYEPTTRIVRKFLSRYRFTGSCAKHTVRKAVCKKHVGKL